MGMLMIYLEAMLAKGLVCVGRCLQVATGGAKECWGSQYNDLLKKVKGVSVVMSLNVLSRINARPDMSEYYASQ